MRRSLSIALLSALVLAACAPTPRPGAVAPASTPVGQAAARAPGGALPAAAPSPVVARTVPEGWSTAAPLKPAHAMALRSEGWPLDVASLPVLELDVDGRSRLREIDVPRPGTKLEGPKATEVRTLGARVTIAGRRFGGIQVGVGQMPFFDFTEGGTSLMNSHGITTMSWTSFDAAADGLLDVQMVRGFYDADRKQAVEREHLDVHAAPIVEGSYYAFRTVCSTCAIGERERLHLVGPGVVGNLDGEARREMTAGALVAYVSLPLDPGTAGGASTFLSAGDAIAWGKRTGLPIDRPSRVPVGFYASRGAGDAAPVVVVRIAKSS